MRVLALAHRLRSQLLSGKAAADPVAVARRLLAIQAQDPRGARLAIRARTARGTAADVERALGEDRTLLITWLCRGTLHLVCAEDYPWLHALTTPPLRVAATRRLNQEGVGPARARRAVATIERALAEEGPLTREQLRERITSSGVAADGQALIHLLFLAAIDGVAVRGPMVGKQHAFVLARDWLGPAKSRPVDRDRALAELARRYLAGHSPASDRDLARWAGVPLRDARSGLGAIAGELVQRDDGLVALGSAAAAVRTLPPPRMLGAFDPVLVGWKDRRFVCGSHDRAVVTGGVFRPFALVDGQVAGTWQLRDSRPVLDPLVPLSRAVRAALEADAGDVRRYLGLVS